ncbi:MAG: hypothetical protein LBQ52_09785 [Helicobacteraceae bacterium]|nr:hypothetical protein [Helicobacteraceae bacterium]
MKSIKGYAQAKRNLEEVCLRLKQAGWRSMRIFDAQAEIDEMIAKGDHKAAEKRCAFFNRICAGYKKSYREFDKKIADRKIQTRRIGL